MPIRSSTNVRINDPDTGFQITLTIPDPLTQDYTLQLPAANGTLSTGGGGGGTLANNTYLLARNAANDGDIDLIKANTANSIQVGDDSTANSKILLGGGGSDQYVTGKTGLAIVNNANPLVSLLRATPGGSFGQFEFAATDFHLVGPQDGNSTMTLKLWDNDFSNFVGIKAPGVIASDITLTLPSDDGSSGDALLTDGSGNLSFGAPGWVKVVKSYTDFSDVGDEKTINILAIPSGYFIEHIGVRLVQTFASPLASAIDMEAAMDPGDSTGLSGLGQSVFGAPPVGWLGYATEPNASGTEYPVFVDFTQSRQLTATLFITDDTLDEMTAGIVNFYVKMSKLP